MNKADIDYATTRFPEIQKELTELTWTIADRKNTLKQKHLYTPEREQADKDTLNDYLKRIVEDLSKPAILDAIIEWRPKLTSTIVLALHDTVPDLITKSAALKLIDEDTDNFMFIPDALIDADIALAFAQKIKQKHSRYHRIDVDHTHEGDTYDFFCFFEKIPYEVLTPEILKPLLSDYKLYNIIPELVSLPSNENYSSFQRNEWVDQEDQEWEPTVTLEESGVLTTQGLREWYKLLRVIPKERCITFNSYYLDKLIEINLIKPLTSLFDAPAGRLSNEHFEKIEKLVALMDHRSFGDKNLTVQVASFREQMATKSHTPKHNQQNPQPGL